jgi:aminomethyltransferase
MRRTPLFDLHREAGGRMVDFAGWEMPLHYTDGINQEHIAVRTDVGLFDVSHMAEFRVLGPQATDFLSYATLNDPAKLRPGRAHYTMLPNDRGGLIDDLYLYREKGDEFLVVANAANHAPVAAQLRALSADYDCHVVDESETWALLAIQGPGSALLLGRHIEIDLTAVRKNRTRTGQISGCPVRLARTGYTGEDGFEIFCHPTDAPIVWEILTEAGAKACGLGARDTLRLEAGYPLYGHEFDERTNPLCTPMAWVVKDKPFFGRAAMWGTTCSERLVGLRLLERGIARPGYRLLHHGTDVGKVTSGTISPLTRESIAFAWIRGDLAEEGTEVQVEVRGQGVPAAVTTPPFFSQ